MHTDDEHRLLIDIAKDIASAKRAYAEYLRETRDDVIRDVMTYEAFVARYFDEVSK